MSMTMIWVFRCQFCDRPNRRTRDWWYCAHCGWFWPTEIGRKRRDPKPEALVLAARARERQP